MRLAQLTHNPPNHPYTCFRCLAHSEVRDYFIDAGIDTDFDGSVYICNMCMTDLFHVTPDYFSKEEVDNIVIAQQAISTKASVIVEDYNNKLQAFKELGIDLEKLLESAKNGRISKPSDDSISDESERAASIPVKPKGKQSTRIDEDNPKRDLFIARTSLFS